MKAPPLMTLSVAIHCQVLELLPIPLPKQQQQLLQTRAFFPPLSSATRPSFLRLITQNDRGKGYGSVPLTTPL
ncbi:hypothetical protein LX36DRAFT_355520 [Colletotrichum falcatum]|nr:hypothetical protein LX36DRAFT_355520 [Colletotrichum falcatum]